MDVAGANIKPTPTADQMVERARDLALKLRQRSAQAEELRRVPDESIADILEAEIFRICQPSRYGGFDMGWDVLCECSMEMAHGCGSQAWVANVFGEHSYLAGLFPDQAQAEVWGQNSEQLISTSFVPVGNEVKVVEDGFILDGHWPFSSGVHHASWTILGELVKVDDGPPQHHFFLVPVEDLAIVDDWQTMGMVGTGSCSVALKNKLVPAHRALPNALIQQSRAPGADVNKAPIFRMPMFGFAGIALASIPVGIAEGMVTEFVADLKEAIATGPQRPGLETLQARITESAAEVQAARLLILNSARTNMAALARGDRLGPDEAALTSRDGSYAAALAKRAATRLYEATGGKGIYLTNQMQRAFRDVYAGTAHTGVNWDRTCINYGRHLLGMDPLPGRGV